MKLFGTDGVRGKAGEKLSAATSMRLAMAAGIYFRQFASHTNTILLGKDTRKSGYMIETAIVAGRPDAYSRDRVSHRGYALRRGHHDQRLAQPVLR